MFIQPTNQVTFGYHHPLKTAWLKGKLPTVTHGFYGEKLTKKNISLEHLKPVSQGGKSTFDNLVLADKQKNNERGAQPIERFVNIGMLRAYLNQFKGVKNQYIDGDEYIKGIRGFFKKLMEEA